MHRADVDQVGIDCITVIHVARYSNNLYFPTNLQYKARENRVAKTYVTHPISWWQSLKLTRNFKKQPRIHRSNAVKTCSKSSNGPYEWRCLQKIYIYIQPKWRKKLFQQPVPWRHDRMSLLLLGDICTQFWKVTQHYYHLPIWQIYWLWTLRQTLAGMLEGFGHVERLRRLLDFFIVHHGAICAITAP